MVNEANYFQAEIIKRTLKERDAALERVEAAESRLNEVLDFIKTLVDNGHFYDCLPGQRGDPPDDNHCSFVCTLSRALIATTPIPTEEPPNEPWFHGNDPDCLGHTDGD